MADVAQLFRTGLDLSGNPIAYDSRQEGAAAASVNAIPSLAFKDNSGNLVFPQLDSAGRLGVTQTVGTCLDATGKETPGGVGVDADVATITLANSETYKNIEFSVSCYRGAEWEIIADDNGSETILAQGLVAPGQPSFGQKLECLEFTSGATGAQQLIVRMRNSFVVSDCRANIAALQVA